LLRDWAGLSGRIPGRHFTAHSISIQCAVYVQYTLRPRSLVVNVVRLGVPRCHPSSVLQLGSMTAPLQYTTQLFSKRSPGPFGPFWKIIVVVKTRPLRRPAQQAQDNDFVQPARSARIRFRRSLSDFFYGGFRSTRRHSEGSRLTCILLRRMRSCNSRVVQKAQEVRFQAMPSSRCSLLRQGQLALPMRCSFRGAGRSAAAELLKCLCRRHSPTRSLLGPSAVRKSVHRRTTRFRPTWSRELPLRAGRGQRAHTGKLPPWFQNDECQTGTSHLQEPRTTMLRPHAANNSGPDCGCGGD